MVLRAGEDWATEEEITYILEQSTRLKDKDG
jgi:hypothetical protein